MFIDISKCKFVHMSHQISIRLYVYKYTEREIRWIPLKSCSHDSYEQGAP